MSRKGPTGDYGQEIGCNPIHLFKFYIYRHLKADIIASPHLRPEKPVEEMTSEEKQFYHFKMHDYDNNNLLDGLELLQSANVHDASFHGHHEHQQQKSPTDTDEEPDNGGAGSEELGLQHLVGKQRPLLVAFFRS